MCTAQGGSETEETVLDTGIVGLLIHEMKLMISVHGQQGSSIIPDLFLILNILKQKAEAQGEPEF